MRSSVTATQSGETSYRYDLFISYHRTRLTLAWLQESFLEDFTEVLAYEVADRTGREVEIFYDRAELPDDEYNAMIRGVPVGDVWRRTFTQAITSSRCMLGLWTPLYFMRAWCMAELNSFHHRQEKGHPRPIIGVSLHGGIPKHPIASSYQACEFDHYFFTGVGFASSERAFELQKRIKFLAAKVADAIDLAPPRESWRVDLPPDAAGTPSSQLPVVPLPRI